MAAISGLLLIRSHGGCALTHRDICQGGNGDVAGRGVDIVSKIMSAGHLVPTGARQCWRIQRERVACLSPELLRGQGDRAGSNPGKHQG
jgi:hypothetical protein